MRAEDKPMKDIMRKHGPVIALATAPLASCALVLNSISGLRAGFRAAMTDLRQDFRTEFEKVDARFEHMDARLYELTERVARIEGHLVLTRVPVGFRLSETSTISALTSENTTRDSRRYRKSVAFDTDLREARLAYNRFDCGGLVMSTLRPARIRQKGKSTSWHFSEPLRPAGRRTTQGSPQASVAWRWTCRRIV